MHRAPAAADPNRPLERVKGKEAFVVTDIYGVPSTAQTTLQLSSVMLTCVNKHTGTQSHTPREWEG